MVNSRDIAKKTICTKLRCEQNDTLLYKCYNCVIALKESTEVDTATLLPIHTLVFCCLNMFNITHGYTETPHKCLPLCFTFAEWEVTFKFGPVSCILKYCNKLQLSI